MFLTRAVSRKLFGSGRSNPPSRFLSDVPLEIMKDLSPDPPAVSLLRSQPRRDPQEVWVDRSFDQSCESISVQPGQTVRHPKFGQGRVIAVHPGNTPKVEVEFPAFGRKRILLSYLEFG